MLDIIIRGIKRVFPTVSTMYHIAKEEKKDRQLVNRLSAMKVNDYPLYLKELYLKSTGKQLDLVNPIRYTEKIQWRKLYDRDKMYAVLSDKYLVRKWVEQTIGKQYLIPLLGEWEAYNKIDFESLPQQFVLKTNNASHTNLIVTDKDSFLKKRRAYGEWFSYWLRRPYELLSFELQYKYIKPRIIAECYLKPEKGRKDLTDFKFYCFNGNPIVCQVISDRSMGETIDYYDMEWNHISLRRVPFQNSEKGINKPDEFDLMHKIAKELCKGFQHVRVDLYLHEGHVFFGEMTFTPAGGFMVFEPDTWDFKLGEYWDISIEQIDESIVMRKCNFYDELLKQTR